MLPEDGPPVPPHPTEQRTLCVPAVAGGDGADIPRSQQDLGFDSVWPITRGAGQRIAVIDTGVSRHPRLPALEGGGDYVGTSDGTDDCDSHGTVVAGLIADALSMGSSGYLAAKSEQEVYANEIAMERDEIALMPEVERDELALIYEAKGMSGESARALATEVMADPERMLEEQTREELGIGEPHMSPLREGWVTGLATAIGALIPVFPFLIWTGMTAVIVSFAVSMASHWIVGAARSVFTGRSVFRSGLDMFVVGLGVAVVGYIVGERVATWIG